MSANFILTLVSLLKFERGYALPRRRAEVGRYAQSVGATAGGVASKHPDASAPAARASFVYVR